MAYFRDFSEVGIRSLILEKARLFYMETYLLQKCVLGCNLGLDVRYFGMIFGKRKRMTTNPATRPFWVFVGSGIDVMEGDINGQATMSS